MIVKESGHGLPWTEKYESLSEFEPRDRMIAALSNHMVKVLDSDGRRGVFEGRTLLQRASPLLEALRDPAYFGRAFIDAGGLCWPNGLGLSPARVHEQCRVEVAQTFSDLPARSADA